MESPLQVAFYVLAGVVQMALAGWLVARERREWTLVLAALFLLNGLGALGAGLFLQHPENGDVADWGRNVLHYHTEPATFVLLAYLALAFPMRPRALERRPWVLPVLAGAALVVLEASLALWPEALHRPRSGAPLNAGRLVVGYVLPAFTWGLLAARWALLWPRVESPAQRRPFQLVYAAFILRAGNVLVVTFPVAQEGPAWAVAAAQVLNAGPLFLLLASLAYLLRSQARASGVQRRQGLFVASFLLLGVAEGMLAIPMGGAYQFFGNVFLHVDLYVARPVLVWFAVAQAPGQPAPGAARGGYALLAVLAFAAFLVGVSPVIQLGALSLPVSIAVSAALAVAATLLLRAWLRTSGEAGRAPGTPWVAGEVVLGRYQVAGLMGEGAWGEVHHAVDTAAAPGDPRDVVLKRTNRLDAGHQKALLREADLLSRLDHPRIVWLLRQERGPDGPVLVLEFLPGGSLQDRLGDGPLPPHAAVPPVLDVLDALAAAHAVGVLHRDVKPANVLLGPDGRAKLADFGNGAAVPPAGLLGDPTGTLPGAGSLRYLSPEQVQGRSVDHRSDLYSAAVVLYELLAGRHPVPPTLLDLEVRQAIVGRPPPAPAGVPPRLWAVLRRALHKAPGRRFQSAAAFREALEDALRPARGKASHESGKAAAQRRGPAARPS